MKLKIGQVFTPQYVVTEMLDFIGYTQHSEITQKHVIDNSCGDGAFLKEVVKRYIDASYVLGKKPHEIKHELQIFIHGLDIDEEAIQSCIKNLNEVAKQSGIDDVSWDVRCLNSLDEHSFDGMIDYVVGNPPYVRVHDFKDKNNYVTEYSFLNGGMTDLYLAFFELGFRMLSENGVMTYITPSSWFSSNAGANLRKYIVETNELKNIIDFGHTQVFDGVTTYCAISVFERGSDSDKIGYYNYNNSTKSIDFVDMLSLHEILFHDKFYFSDKESLSLLRKIKDTKTGKVKVKNGFATLSDKNFIGEHVPDTFITKRIIKASTGKWTKCLFPYDVNGKPLSKEMLFSNDVIRDYFENKKDDLSKGNFEKEWWLYGRTQGINDVCKNKVSMNVLIRDVNSVKLHMVKEGECVYSGLYILNCDYSTITTILKSNDFINYLKILKKYKSGGYYTFSSKDLEQFINYHLTK